MHINATKNSNYKTALWICLTWTALVGCGAAESGDVGAAGSQGIAGTNGRDGTDGATGTAGVKGETGAVGAAGKAARELNKTDWLNPETGDIWTIGAFTTGVSDATSCGKLSAPTVFQLVHAGQLGLDTFAASVTAPVLAWGTDGCYKWATQTALAVTYQVSNCGTAARICIKAKE